MNSRTFDNPTEVANAAVVQTIELLSQAIERYGSATWVLAGGSTPDIAYDILAKQYVHKLDWSKVVFTVGDERIGPLDGPDNNWHRIDELFLKHIPEATFLRPPSDTPVAMAAVTFETALAKIPRTAAGLPRFDVVWLGMGPDGHTLSLFPDHPDFIPDDTRLVAPIHHSPKPPAQRISLTLHALTGSQQIIILATGEGKRAALKDAFQNDSLLPIARASRTQSHTLWLLDSAATP